MSAEEIREISVIRPGIYLSGADAAADWQNLKSRQISHVLNVGGSRIQSIQKSGGTLKCYHPDKFTYKVVDGLEDNYQNAAKAKSVFGECIDFIEQGKRSGGVLVHCRYGVSRSSTMVIAV